MNRERQRGRGAVSVRHHQLELAAPRGGEAIRVSLERVAETERFWRFMEVTRSKLAAGSVERP